jgi:hypothetical protein
MAAQEWFRTALKNHIDARKSDAVSHRRSSASTLRQLRDTERMIGAHDPFSEEALLHMDESPERGNSNTT